MQWGYDEVFWNFATNLNIFYAKEKEKIFY